MNQILVTEKLYITPELKRKKALYKINFIISIIVIIILCSFYIHSEYAKNQEQQISEEILSGLIERQGMNETEQEIANEEDEGVWKIMAASVRNQSSQSQIQIQTNVSNNQNPITSRIINNNSNSNSNLNINTKKNTKKTQPTYVTVNGKRYPSIGRIRISKINVDLAILDQASDDKLVDWLKISPTKFWGPELNEIGNVSIAGHNYRNTRFFSKVPTLTVGDKIKITDISGRTITYKIFKKYEVSPKNTHCINPIAGKENKRVVTLITCTNDSKKRVIVHAEEV